MPNKLTQKFQDIVELTPAPALEQAVLRKIELLEGARVKKARFLSYAGFAASFGAFAVAGFAFGGALVQSEFWSIFSLIFSDMQVVAANWQDFGYSILETLPVVSITAMLVPVAVLLWSMSQYFQWHNRFSQKYVIN